MSLSQLIASQPYFSLVERGDLTLLQMEAPWGKALISPQGAQLLSYQPAEESDLLWLSPQAAFAKGKAIRGGIPVCWPWFGAHDMHADYPAHGYARTTEWECIGISVSEHQATISWSLPSNPAYPPYCANLLLEMTLSADIVLRVSFTHAGEIPERYGVALHSYFPVPHAATCKVHGLADKFYFDKTTSTTAKQSGAVCFSGEVDRVYKDVSGEARIEADLESVQISAVGFQNAIVWNPGEVIASKMADVGAQHWSDFICVENGNVQEHAVMLSDGEQFQGTVRIFRR